MSKNISGWDEVHDLADELELKIHLGGMDARDRWQALQPRIAHLETSIAQSGERVEDAVLHEVADVAAALRHLRQDIYMRARGDYMAGW